MSVEKWKEAHPGIIFPDAALKPMLPFASLAANDFIAFLESRNVGTDIVSFVRDMARELAWVYDNWAQAQRDADAVKLMDDLVRNVPKGEPFTDFLYRFIRDYRNGNNLNWPEPDKQHEWEEAMKQAPDRVAM